MIRLGYELWARQINERGGLLGKPVDLLLKDDRSDPQQAEEVYRSLIEEEGVDLLLSPYGTPLTLAASRVTEEAGYVMVASAAAATLLWERDARFLFGIYATANRYFIGYLDLIAREGMERVAIIHEESPFHREAAEGARSWARRFGLSVVSSASYPPDAMEAPRLVRAVMEAEAEAVVVCSYPDEGYRLLKAGAAAGWTPRALAMTIAPTHPHFPRRAGAPAEMIFAPSQWEPMRRIPFPGSRDFIELFREHYGLEPSYHAASAYAAGQILEHAIAATGSLDQEELRKFILALDTVTIIGRFKVNREGLQIGHNPLLIQWQGGEKEIVYPRRLRTAPPRFLPEGDR
jgi:branched-chain amino acid transport system substrate-binding protein